MATRNKDVAPVRARILGDALLARVHQLNKDYVELLLQQPADSCGLPAALLHGLAQLPEPARVQLGTVPYALFSLGFEDPPLWDCILESGAPPEASAHRYAVTAVCSADVFCETALFFAWHTAVLNRLAARFLFAMSDALVERFVHTPLSRLRHIAAEFPYLMQPRWRTNPCFWLDLVRFSATQDWSHLKLTQLLGMHLTAIDLDTAFELEGAKARGRRSDPRLKPRMAK